MELILIGTIHSNQFGQQNTLQSMSIYLLAFNFFLLLIKPQTHNICPSIYVADFLAYTLLLSFSPSINIIYSFIFKKYLSFVQFFYLYDDLFQLILVCLSIYLSIYIYIHTHLNSKLELFLCKSCDDAACIDELQFLIFYETFPLS